MTTLRPPRHVTLPIAWQRWSTFSALHWRYDADVLQSRLPDGLQVQTFDGSAWLSITPFLMQALPLVPAFPETNVRTYVVDREGRDGIWFFSLDAASLALVTAARAAYRLPYHWARMAVEERRGTVTYRSRRRWPGPASAVTSITVEVGERIAASEVSNLAVFLDHRWRGFAPLPLGTGFTPVEHEPWPLHQATVRHLDESLLAAANLERPASEPIVHYSPGVAVRLGPPRRVR